MITIHTGDCRAILATLPAGLVHCCVTSPPYFGLRDYGNPDQIGLEATPDAYVSQLVAVFREVRRVLRDDGVVFLNLGDSYASSSTYNAPRSMHSEAGWQQPGRGPNAHVRAHLTTKSLKPKDLLGIPWRVAFALQADGWFLRQDIIWHKPNPMPESVTDRCTKAHEYIFLLTKRPRYYFDAAAIREANTNPESPECITPWQDRPGNGEWPSGTGGRMGSVQNGRNRRSVWTIPSQPFASAHFATYPPALIEPCILAGCPVGGLVLDPFGGAGTTGLVADRLGRNAILIELNPAYADMARDRVAYDGGMFAEVA